ncbi:H+ Antiporter protein [Mycolicibacterium phlei]|jgi:H+ antiporter protein|uniref:Multidrug efflux pump Tap n=1 Tax=Mycolicibacterium phlei DSM 43239 = CCUG 21000 TaxID=1226750 RepID=A0A5N5UUB1_MYCPH|nr:MFS transporter [Mycolicibacterium phlei]VEG10890.1 H+ Antiporter protein [Mycobacteroides chelonae]AMO62790.1 putative multidrug-efflux transporter [Mycolicibacterium phlei]EID12979.1 H+ antiporter protein [Mycolicibacterium phlei RIVM601174]KAB7752089.1 MFS transporter [Mycolicibacterium phlei DSM 43239 = CCUG 21000]KXW59442.1 MFS transporter [Mycolicibacterium phlei DSM 43072]
MTNTRRGPLLLVLFAALTAGAGNGISLVAFPWLVLQRNGSAVEASIVAMAGTLPLLVATLIAGAAVDYLGRRRVSMLSDALSALSVATVPVLALTFGVQAVNVAVLAALAALGAFFDPAGMTARETMLPEAATRAGWTLDRANSFYEAVFNLAYIVGPGIGGLLIATLGGINTMWVTAGAFVASIVAIAALRLEGAGRPDREALPDGVWAGIVEGLRFVWRSRVLRTLAIVDLVATGLYMPMESVLFPKYFTDREEPAQLGWVLMALSIGGLVGALGYAWLSERMSRRATMLTAVLTLGVAMTVIAFLPPLPLILVLCAIVGLVYGPIAPIYNYVMQTQAPPHLRGRVVGVMGSLAYAAGPLGLIVAGPLADTAGLNATFLALALPMVALGVVSLFLSALRELDRPA